MAYITKAQVQAKTKALKAINTKYGVKASFSGSNSSSLTLTIHSGKIDFIASAIFMLNNDDSDFALYNKAGHIEQLNKYKHIQVNHYHMDNSFEGIALQYLKEVYALMTEGHYDRSDAMTDYFECSWYNSIHIGKWNKPYELIA